MKRDEEWRPNPGPQTEYFIRDEFEVGYGGARGGGKTDALIAEHLRGIHHPEYRGIIFRKTFPELTEVIDRSHKYYSAIKTPDGVITGKFNAQKYYWTFSTGAKVELGSMHTEESKYRYIGRQFVKVCFDQLEQFSQTQYEFMFGQVRTVEPDLVKYIGIRSTSNPGGPGHAWVKARFIDDKIPYKTYHTVYKLPDGKTIDLTSTFIPAKVYDNPKITEVNPQYVAVLMSLPDDLRRAWLDGDWNVFVGQFFREFRPDVHGVEPFEIPEDWEIYGGMDYGEANQTSYGIYAASTPEWQAKHGTGLYRVGEYYSAGAGPDHNREIDNLVNECRWTKKSERGKTIQRRPKLVYADPSMWIDRKHDVGRIKSAAMAFSLPMVRGTHDRINGWRCVKRLLHWDMDDKGRWITKPKFQYFKGECPNFERTLPTIIHAGTQGEPNAEDAKKGGEDHCADEFRYMAMGLYGPIRKVEEEKKKGPVDAHLEYFKKIEEMEGVVGMSSVERDVRKALHVKGFDSNG